MVEIYQIHATLQVLALLSLLIAAYGAKRHKLAIHHRSLYSALALATLAVAMNVYTYGGLPSTHGRVGFSIYLFVLATALSGKLFLGGKLRRNQHRALAFIAIPAWALMILYGLFTFVF